MIKNSLLFIALVLFLTGTAFGQDSLQTKNQSGSVKDSATHFIKWNLESRTFFMSTINEGKYKDDYALATVIALGFETGTFHNFKMGLGGYYNFRLTSSELTDQDPVSGGSNRYESGLFDLQDPGNYKNMAQIETLYLKYQRSGNMVMAGRFKLNNPFVNPQDGRMRPTFEEGLWFNLFQKKKINFNGGYLTRILTRGTNNWYKPGATLGFFPTGLNEEGDKSGYAGNVKSNFIAIANITLNVNENFKIDIWDGYIDNVLNTAMTEFRYEHKINSGKLKMYEGLILMHQDAVNDGGNSDPSKTYTKKGSQSNIISFQAGVKNKRLNTSINYTHITGDGRYLMPREWGKEVFYTFMPRERNEGAGNVHAFMIKAAVTSKNEKLKSGLGYGYFQMPDIKNYRLNKYGMPSYHQINYDITYSFKKQLSGLELRALIAYKIGAGETYNNPKAIYNKVDMANLNFMVIYKI